MTSTAVLFLYSQQRHECIATSIHPSILPSPLTQQYAQPNTILSRALFSSFNFLGWDRKKTFPLEQDEQFRSSKGYRAIRSALTQTSQNTNFRLLLKMLTSFHHFLYYSQTVISDFIDQVNNLFSIFLIVSALILFTIKNKIMRQKCVFMEVLGRIYIDIFDVWYHHHDWTDFYRSMERPMLQEHYHTPSTAILNPAQDHLSVYPIFPNTNFWCDMYIRSVSRI